MSRFYGKFRLPLLLAPALIFLLVAALGLLRAVPFSYAQSQPDVLGSISGTVRNQAGDPLPNITVYVGDLTFFSYYRLSVRSTKTDAQGQYYLPSLAPDAYQLRFEDDSHLYAKIFYGNVALVSESPLVNVSGNNMAGIDVVMTPANTVSVTIDATLLPYSLNHVAIDLYGKTVNNRWELYELVDWIDYDGALVFDEEFVFHGIPDGSYGLCVMVSSPYRNGDSQSECYDNVRPDAALPNGAKDIVLSGASHKTFALVLGDFHQLQGVVLSTTGEPLKNAEVYARNETRVNYDPFNVRTDSQGRFYFDSLWEDSYRIEASAADYLSNYATAPRLYIGPASRESVTLTLQLGGSITGIVSLDGGGIAHNASVRALPPDGPWDPVPAYSESTYVEPATGAYTITGLAAGIYRVRAALQYGITGQYVINFYGGPDLQSADDVMVAVGKTTPKINIILGSGKFEGSIKGTVTAAAVPKANVEVGLWIHDPNVFEELQFPPMLTTVTDAQGKYHFDGLIDGYYFVGFRDLNGDYATTFYPGTPVIITGKMTRDNVNVNLVPGSTIRGTIRRPPGENAADFYLYLTSASSGFIVPYVNAMSDLNGDYEITGLSPGIYNVYAYAPYLYSGQGEQAGIVVGDNVIVEGIDFWIDTTFDMFLPTLSKQR